MKRIAKWSAAAIVTTSLAAATIMSGAIVMAQQIGRADQTLACTLTTAELQARRAGIIRRLREAAETKKELKDGWSFRFSDGQADDLFEFVKLERQCCTFLKFSLTFEPANGPIWLSITGPAAAKGMIAAELGPVSR